MTDRDSQTRSTEKLQTTLKPTTSLEDKIDSLEEKVAEKSLAWEMLKEQKKTIKRLFTTIFILIAFIFVMICSFLGTAMYFYNNFEFQDVATETEYIQDGQGTNIIGDSNEVNN